MTSQTSSAAPDAPVEPASVPGIVDGRLYPTKERPREVKLSHEEGEALSERLAGDALTVADRHVLVEEALGRMDGGKIAGGR